uniref:Uncharacterized protein n=1 Tax=Sphaerodactylus townsendi TaxID=933632 RepID=A0ACB8F0S3_9SAUR
MLCERIWRSNGGAWKVGSEVKELKAEEKSSDLHRDWAAEVQKGDTLSHYVKAARSYIDVLLQPLLSCQLPRICRARPPPDIPIFATAFAFLPPHLSINIS